MTDQDKIHGDINDDKPVYEAPQLTVLDAGATQSGIASNPVEGPITQATVS